MLSRSGSISSSIICFILLLFLSFSLLYYAHPSVLILVSKSNPIKVGWLTWSVGIHSQESKNYTLMQTLEGHTDWVRDVAWSPSILSKSYIASASQDKTVRIWTSDASNPAQWTSNHLEFDTVLWRVSWSLSGNILAISGGDNKVSLWKENLKGQWEKVKDIEE